MHFQKNLNKQIRKAHKETFCKELKDVFNPDDVFYTVQEGIDKLKQLLKRWAKTYPKLETTLNRDDLDSLFTYLNFDYRVRRMIYTTNWIERLNKSFRRTLKMRNALPSPQAAITLLGFVAMEMEEKTYSYPITNFKFDQYFN